MGYRFLDHTADAGIEVEAASRDGLFATALEGFTDTITELAAVKPVEERRLEVAAVSLEELMVEWLGELLYRFETEGLLFRRARVAIEESEEGGEGLTLQAQAQGQAYAAGRHPLKVLIKAVTYHALEVGPAGGGWRARVIFDI